MTITYHDDSTTITDGDIIVQRIPDRDDSPEESEALKMAINSGKWIDASKIAAKGQEVARTFCRQGPRMYMKGKGCTRIDGVFLNRAAAALWGEI